MTPPDTARIAQAPLRDLYRRDPVRALVIDHALARCADPADPFHSWAQPMGGCGAGMVAHAPASSAGD